MTNEELSARDYLLEDRKTIAILVPIVAGVITFLCGACMATTMFLLW